MFLIWSNRYEKKSEFYHDRNINMLPIIQMLRLIIS